MAVAEAIVDLEGFELESHVAAAIAAAVMNKAGDPVDTADILQAAVALAGSGAAPSTKPTAFARLADLLPATAELARAETEPERGLIDKGRNTNIAARFPASPELAHSFQIALDLFGQQEQRQRSRFWGRDLVATVLLATDDPSLADLAQKNGTSVAALQDSWYHFVADGGHRSQRDWEAWWRRASVPLWNERVPIRIIDAGKHPLMDGIPPEWASGWGQDRFGVYAEITVEEVTQRLRWIPPGRFLRGSLAEEVGRYDWEGPQREVLIGAGYWLFATPVTQGLYEAVTGENPSRFKGADRPVESVSWHDARKFLDRLNDLVPGLDLVLPSEVQWEYACRAGTTTATYAGDLPDLENAGAEVLDGIAWFGENSGSETHPVALKTPNGWGLYDMLGNVIEWCADHWHESYDGAPSDGSAWLDENAHPGASRVIRGGSWRDGARYCRAAYRHGSEPGYRFVLLGFRPARGQV